MIVVRRAQPYPNPVFGEPVKSICRHFPWAPNKSKQEGRRCSPAPQQARIIRSRFWLRGLLFRHLAAVGCAAALALARVLAFATIVTALAAALALAGVLALTGVLF